MVIQGPANLLTHPHEWRYTLRLTDNLVYSWVGGKHACTDLTRVSLLVGLRT